MENIHRSKLQASKIHQVQVDGAVLTQSSNTEEKTLRNTLFEALYPYGHLACLTVPSARMEVFRAVAAGVYYKGIRYVPIGSRKSAARGELYLVDERTAADIFRRFGQCGEALISNFEILTNPCTTIRKERDLTVAFVNHVLPGSYDWRGRIKQSVAERLGLDLRMFQQFVMAFAGSQMRAELKVAADHLMDKDFFGADIALPTKAAKPLPSPLVSLLIGTLRGPAVFGFAEVPASELETGSEMLFNRMAEHVCSSDCNVPLVDAVRALVEQRLKEKRSHVLAMQIGTECPRRIELV
jgi:hypothetical protein